MNLFLKLFYFVLFKVTEQLDLLGLQQLLAANQQLPAAVIQQLLGAANIKFATPRQPPKPANQLSPTTNRAATPQLLNEAAFQQLLAAQQASSSDRKVFLSSRFLS